ncbi:sulfite exporter TauE/SafE family protein [Microbulbifer celer]|uniref:Sulfite exporter TauE/SafE family protein n=1 Tax=Microbulbifer celer TaxID=435905 RepID=A0ABW3U3I4_9GAMM|nr:sulfite exporter TauE/SafE family protein [Microbulbifer celer]UFN58193.1 sulfite exporter TauE/SafE family protein [Microbulbifer celer]
MEHWSYLAAALVIGFLGSSHCIGMCGGISGALGLAVPGQKPAWGKLLGYSAGRVASYALMGLLVGLLGAYLSRDLATTLAPLRIVAGLMLIAMALYLANWWRGLVWLEKGGSYLWRYLQPLSRSLLPVRSTSQALALGALWGWLPCGLVYSALTFALAQGNGPEAALAMAAFGLGTVPAVVASGAAAVQLRTLVQKPGVRLSMALLILLFGLWTLWGALHHGGHAHGDAHSPMPEGSSALEGSHSGAHGRHMHSAPLTEPGDSRYTHEHVPAETQQEAPEQEAHSGHHRH